MKIPQEHRFHCCATTPGTTQPDASKTADVSRYQHLLDKTFSYRVGDWCRPNRKSGHRWRGHRVYLRRSCKSNGSDGTSEQALPRTVVRRFIPGSWQFLQFFVMGVPQGNDASRAVCERVPYVFERLGIVLSQTSSRKVVPATLHWHRSQNIPRHLSPEDHEVRRWYPRGNAHLHRVVGRHNHVPKLR